MPLPAPRRSAQRRADDDEARLAADRERVGEPRTERILVGQDWRTRVEDLPAVGGRLHGANVVDSRGANKKRRRLPTAPTSIET